MASQGIVPVYELVRNTTLPSMTITYAVNGGVPPFASAQFFVAQGDNVFYSAACTLANGSGTKNVITPEVDPKDTINWPLGEVTWSVRTVTTSNVAKEHATGSYLVKRTNSKKK